MIILFSSIVQFQLTFLIITMTLCLAKYIDSTWLNPEYKIWLEAMRDFLAAVYHISLSKALKQYTCLHV